MVPGDDEDEGGNGGVIIDPNRSVNQDYARATELCDAIACTLRLLEEPGAQDGYADIVSQKLEEALFWAEKHRAGFE